MSRQPSLLSITKEDGTTVLLPQNNGQVQAVRNDAAFGSGTYYAYFENGTRELIGGPGAGTISGGGTLNFIPKFTPDGSTLGNSSLFDNGNIGYGTVAPVGVAAFDIVSTTKGVLLPRMTTAQRNLIAVGATTDGLLIYNTSTEKYNFWNQTLGIWESIDTSTGGDVSGSGTTDFIPRWTDGPNSILGDSIIRDNGTVAAVNRAVIATTMFAVQGADAANVNYTFQTYNSTPVQTFGVRNDGYIYAGVGSSMTIGALSGFDAALVGNTFLGVGIGASTTTGAINTAVGYQALFSTTTGGINTAIGYQALHFNTTGTLNVAIGYQALYNNISGSQNTATGLSSLSNNRGGSNTASGMESLLMNTTGNLNTAFGYQSLYTNTINSGSVALGAQAGFYETAGNKLFIDNNSRIDETDGRIKAMVYGVFAAAMADQEFHVNAAKINLDDLPTGNAGVASGFLYVDTAANILANADLIIARKV